MSQFVEQIHADLNDIEARIKAAYEPEALRLREIEADVTRVLEIRHPAGIHAGGILSKLEAIAAHMPTLHMLIDNLERDHPDADSPASAPAVAAPSTEA